MRSCACRRLGSLGFAFRSAPANTTIAQTTRFHHGGPHSHAPLSFASAVAGDAGARVGCGRRETTECCGLADENVRPRIKLSGVAARQVFAARDIRLKPLCVVAGVGSRNRAGVCEDQLAMSNVRNDIALTHDNACSVIARGACLDARAALAARVSDWPNRLEPLGPIAWCKGSRFERREVPQLLAKRFGAAAAATRTGDEERAARHLAVTAANRPRNRRRKPPRCLKPLPTSLEAIDGRGTRAEKRSGQRQGGVATSSSQGRAFCRGIGRRGCRLMQRDRLSASSGWLRRPG
jgi:hypothetical protein